VLKIRLDKHDIKRYTYGMPFFDYGEHMNKQEQDAFVHAFITRIGGVDEDKVAPWVRGESVDLPYKHIEILQDALSFWLLAREFQSEEL